jgi:hypothetical protein
MLCKVLNSLIWARLALHIDYLAPTTPKLPLRCLSNFMLVLFLLDQAVITDPVLVHQMVTVELGRGEGFVTNISGIVRASVDSVRATLETKPQLLLLMGRVLMRFPVIQIAERGGTHEGASIRRKVLFQMLLSHGLAVDRHIALWLRAMIVDLAS